MANWKTGKLKRSGNFQERCNRAFKKKKSHHCLRMTRILAHLHAVGFRKYAIELLKFLEKEIYGEVGMYKKLRTRNNSPLNKLSSINKVDFDKEPMEFWQPFGQNMTEIGKESALFGLKKFNLISKFDPALYKKLFTNENRH